MRVPLLIVAACACAVAIRVTMPAPAPALTFAEVMRQGRITLGWDKLLMRHLCREIATKHGSEVAASIFPDVECGAGLRPFSLERGSGQ